MSTTAKNCALLSETPASVEVSDYDHNVTPLLCWERATELRQRHLKSLFPSSMNRFILMIVHVGPVPPGVHPKRARYQPRSARFDADSHRQLPTYCQ